MGEGPATVVTVEVLGRPRLRRSDGTAHELRGHRQVGLLALLVAHRGRPLRRDLIEEELWSGDRVEPSAVRVTVGRLRKQFVAAGRPDPITSGPAGYAVALDATTVDAGRFRQALDAARAAWAADDVAAVVDAAVAGERLWRGPAYEGVCELPSIVPDQNRLDESRRDLRDLHAAGLLVSGRSAAALDLLAPAAAEDPYREAVAALGIAALHDLGRTADALAAHDDLVALLAADLGIGPSPALAALRTAIATGAPAHEVQALAAPTRPAHRPALAARPVPDGPPGRASGATTPAPAAATTPFPLVGRRSLLEVADALIAGTGPSVWVLEGPAGLGKTRIGHEVQARAAAAGLAVAAGSCPRDDAVGLLVLRRLLAGLLPAVDPAVVAEPAVGGVLTTAFPELADLVGALPPGPSSARHEPPDVAQVRIYSALERVLMASPPAVVVLDDAHWVDARLGAVLAHLAQRPGPVRWVVLTRVADRGPAAVQLLADLARGGARVDTLPPLGAHDGADIVRAAAPDLAAEVVAAAVDRAGGNPLALVELARHLADGGDLARVPGGLDAIIAAEVGGLDPDAADLARVVAVAGEQHPVTALTAAAGLDGRRASVAVGTLLARGLASGDDRRAHLAPGHDLVRESLVARMTGPEVQSLHRRLADTLATTTGTPPVLRLRHLLECGDATAEEAEELVAAGALRDLLLAPGDIALLSRAVTEVAGLAGTTREQVATRLRLARVEMTLGDISRGERLLRAQDQALHALDDPVLDTLALLTRPDLFRDVDDMGSEASLRRAEDLLARLPADEVELRVRLACWAGEVAIHHDSARARELAAEAEAAMADLPPDIDHDWAATLGGLIAINRMATSMAFDAPVGEAAGHVAVLADLADTTGDPRFKAVAATAGVDLALRTGTLAQVGAAVRELTTLATPAQPHEIRWWALAARAAHDLAAGDYAAAATSRVEAMSSGAGRGMALALGIALVHRFEVDRATGRLGFFHALLPPPSSDVNEGVLAAQAHICLAAGDRPRAVAAADLVAHDNVLATTSTGTWGVVASLGAQAAWDLEHRRLGQVVAADLEGRDDAGLTSIGLVYLGSVSLARGLATVAAGRTDEGLDLLHAAVERETWFDSPPWVARACRAAADVHDRRARPGDGRAAALLRRRATAAEARIVLPPS